MSRSSAEDIGKMGSRLDRTVPTHTLSGAGTGAYAAYRITGGMIANRNENPSKAIKATRLLFGSIPAVFGGVLGLLFGFGYDVGTVVFKSVEFCKSKMRPKLIKPATRTQASSDSAIQASTVDAEQLLQTQGTFTPAQQVAQSANDEPPVPEPAVTNNDSPRRTLELN